MIITKYRNKVKRIIVCVFSHIYLKKPVVKQSKFAVNQSIMNSYVAYV